MPVKILLKIKASLSCSDKNFLSRPVNIFIATELMF